MANYLYSQWNMSRRTPNIKHDTLIHRLSDDVLTSKSLKGSLQSLLQSGIEDEDGRTISGLQDLIEALQRFRQDQLETYNPNFVKEDLVYRLQDIVKSERLGMETRLVDAREDAKKGDFQDAMDLLEHLVKDNVSRLDDLPEGVGDKIRNLRQYDFIDHMARQKFLELLRSLQDSAAGHLIESISGEIGSLTENEISDFGNMLASLNSLLNDKASGKDLKFQEFIDIHGQYFKDVKAGDLEELISRLAGHMAVMHSLMSSVDVEKRKDIEDALRASFPPPIIKDLELLTSTMYEHFNMDKLVREYNFLGDNDVTLDHAMTLLSELQKIDELEANINQAIKDVNLHDLDLDSIGNYLGQEYRSSAEFLQDTMSEFEDEGYYKRSGKRFEFTQSGIRKLGQRALREILTELKRDRNGYIKSNFSGEGWEYNGRSKPYEYEEALDIDLHRTLFNTLTRSGIKIPLEVKAEDFESKEREDLTQTATVLLLDQSRSMGMFGSFEAAKKVALALNYLIISQYPRDRFYVVGFSDYASQVKSSDLGDLRWNAWVSGTNMQHGLSVSRTLLSRQKVSNKQIIMITDGEPTAHIEDGKAVFSYPPDWVTIDETLREVKRCTKEGITINTFMLEANYYLSDFINRITKVNKGRAFFTDAHEMGRYIMKDYFRNIQRVIS